MTEEESVVTEFTRIECATELEISNLDKLAIKRFRSCPAVDLVDSRVFRYAQKLLVPPDPTFCTIVLRLVLFLMRKVDGALEFKPIRDLHVGIVESCTVKVASGDVGDSGTERPLISFDHLLQLSSYLTFVGFLIEWLHNIGHGILEKVP
jgi:hypothetical protein